ncbi:MAG: hypothetical protein HY074_00935 [Deltaproteobacteria bacterium]|nr:hypothetical protein [Deltaproteobacteria bacterium]
MGLIDSKLLDPKYLTSKGYAVAQPYAYDFKLEPLNDDFEPPCGPQIAPLLPGCSEAEMQAAGGDAAKNGSAEENEATRPKYGEIKSYPSVVVEIRRGVREGSGDGDAG